MNLIYPLQFERQFLTHVWTKCKFSLILQGRGSRNPQGQNGSYLLSHPQFREKFEWNGLSDFPDFIQFVFCMFGGTLAVDEIIQFNQCQLTDKNRNNVRILEDHTFNFFSFLGSVQILEYQSRIHNNRNANCLIKSPQHGKTSAVEVLWALLDLSVNPLWIQNIGENILPGPQLADFLPFWLTTERHHPMIVFCLLTFPAAPLWQVILLSWIRLIAL